MSKEIKLAKTVKTGRTLSISSRANNLSILEVGVSGSGKTYAMREIEQNIADNGDLVLVLNYRGTHTAWAEDENAVRISIYDDGLPFPLLHPMMRPDGSVEAEDEVAEGVIDIFNNVTKLSVKQREALYSAVMNVMKSERSDNELRDIAEQLRQSETEAAQDVLVKFRYVLKSVKGTIQRKDALQGGKIYVLDLEKFTSLAQTMLSELIISTIWRYFQIWGQCAQKRVFIVCDEFQAPNLKKDSVLAQILREGRKFHLNLILATQTLDSFNKEQVAVIMQVSTKLIFRPVPSEARKLARYAGAENEREMAQELQKLKCGECIATGQFVVGNGTVERPVKIRF